MSVVQKTYVVDTSNLQTELERTKERFENCIIKKENEYAKLWNDWYKKCDECKYEKISYDKAYKDMQQKIERLQAQLGDLKGMFRINPFKTSKEEKHMPNNVSASARTKPINVSQPPVFTKEDVNSDSNGLSSTGVDNTKTRRPQPRSNTKNDRNVISEVVCAMCKKCLISINHDICLCNYVNGKNSRGKKNKATVSIKEKQKKHQPHVKKPKKVGFLKRLATPKPRKPRFLLRLSPTGRLFDQKGKIVDSSESESQSDCSNGTVRFENDHVAAILGFRDLQWGNILIARQKASHPPKPVPNSRQRLHLLHMDLCGPMRIASINGKRYVLVIVDDYSRYTWVHFLRSKDEAPEVIKTFLKRITVLLQSPVIIIRTDNGTEFKNQVLKEYFDTVGISHQMSSVRTPQQNRVVERRNRTLVEAARTMLIFSRAPLFLWAEAIATACFTQNHSIIHRRFNKTPYELINGKKPDISFLHVFGALCYPKNDREDIGKLGAKGDIGELDLLFEAMYDDYIGGQPSATARTVTAAQEPQVRQTLTTSTSIADTAPTPTNSSSHATNIPITSQDVDELNPNALFDGNTFVNPFNVKKARTDPAWIDSMQEELLQFKRLDVWVLVSAPDNISPLTLKWLFKNKHDEEQTVIRNKSRLIMRGFSDADYAGCKDTFKSTSGEAQFLGEKLFYGSAWQYIKDRSTVVSQGVIRQLRIRRWRYNLIPAESRFKTLCSIIKDKYMMKAQVHMSKPSAISDVQALPQKKHY
nr:Gag-Pol polyprotein [Tanacetum cinerariifolium]